MKNSYVAQRIKLNGIGNRLAVRDLDYSAYSKQRIHKIQAVLKADRIIKNSLATPQQSLVVIS